LRYNLILLANESSTFTKVSTQVAIVHPVKILMSIGPLSISLQKKRDTFQALIVKLKTLVYLKAT